MRTSDDVKRIEKRREKIAQSEEWTNFESLIDEARRLFNPSAATLRTQTAKGARIKDRRVSDMGIAFRKDYTAGIMSEMMTSGEQWFSVTVDDPQDGEAEELERMSSLLHGAMNGNNFVSETYKAISSSCDDGTVIEYVEKKLGEDKLKYCSVPFGCFWFETDYYGVPDTVWIEKKTTVGALVDHYGEENVSQKCRDKYADKPEEEVSVIYYCAPRKERNAKKSDAINKPYELLIYEKEDDPHLLEEGGSEEQMFHVYRVATTGSEVLGRGPCIEALSTMNEIEQVVKDMRNSRRLKTVPILGIPASQGSASVRWIHETACSYMIWNDSGLGGQPPQQIVNAADLESAEDWVDALAKLMRGLFFLDYFNPLQDRRNMTLGEARERVQKSQQMTDQITGPLDKELLTPLIKRSFRVFGESGGFDTDELTWKGIQEQFKGRLKIRFTSRLANAQRMVQLASDLEAAQHMMLVAQGIPEPLLLEYAVQINWAEYPKRIIEGTNARKSLLRPEKEVKKMLKGFADAQARAEQREAISQEADAYSKATKAPEPNSPAAQLQI